MVGGGKGAGVVGTAVGVGGPARRGPLAKGSITNPPRADAGVADGGGTLSGASSSDSAPSSTTSAAAPAGATRISDGSTDSTPEISSITTGAATGGARGV